MDLLYHFTLINIIIEYYQTVDNIFLCSLYSYCLQSYSVDPFSRSDQ